MIAIPRFPATNNENDALRVMRESFKKEAQIIPHFDYETIFDIEKITNNKIELIFLTGGGSNNKSLCQWIANALNIITVSGIAETTTIGNILMQLKADREIENIDEGRQIVSDSFNLEYFKPKTNTDWNFGYMEYLETLKL